MPDSKFTNLKMYPESIVRGDETQIITAFRVDTEPEPLWFHEIKKCDGDDCTIVILGFGYLDYGGRKRMRFSRDDAECIRQRLEQYFMSGEDRDKWILSQGHIVGVTFAADWIWLQ